MTWLHRFIGTTVFGSLPVYLATCLVMLVAEGVYVLFGFGAGLIAVGSLAMVMKRLTDVVVMLLLVSVPPELYVVASSRRQIAWRGVALICIGIGVGVPLGTVALGWGEARAVLLLLGGFLVLAGATFLLLPQAGRPVRWPAWSGPLWGLLSGVLAGLFGTGGPPLILYFRLAGLDKAAFRGNLMAIFLAISVVRLPAYAATGLITKERVIGALLVLPAVLAGALLGHRTHLEVKETTFQRMVAVALLLIGTLLLLR